MILKNWKHKCLLYEWFCFNWLMSWISFIPNNLVMSHGDIRPKNVLVSTSSFNSSTVYVKWTGFGSVKKASKAVQLSQQQVKVSTHWMVPELLKLVLVGDSSSSYWVAGSYLSRTGRYLPCWLHLLLLPQWRCSSIPNWHFSCHITQHGISTIKFCLSSEWDDAKLECN